MKNLITILGASFFSLALFSQVSLTEIWRFKSGGGNSENAEISPDKKFIAGGNSIGEVRIYNFSNGSLIKILDYYKNYDPAISKDGEVESCYFSFDGKYLAAGGNKHGVKVWRVDTWTQVAYFSGGECDGIAFSPNNKWLAAPNGGTIKIYDVSNWSVIATIKHSCGVNSIDFTADSKYMLSGACDKKIYITRTSDWIIQSTINSPGSVKSIRLSPDQKYFATATSDALSSLVYKFPDGTLIKTIKHGTDAEIYYQESVEWTPDSKYLITGGDNQPKGMVKIYDVATWSLVKSYGVHEARRRCEYLARVDNYLVSAGGDGYVVLFKIEGVGSTSNPDPVNIPPTISITSPSNNALFTAPANITITTNASDSDGNILKVEFFNGSTKLGEDNSSPYTYTWNNVVAGNYTIKTIAYDNAGTAASYQITVTVNDEIISTPTIRDAFVTTQAETLDSQKGITINTNDFGYFDAGDYAVYKNMDFKNGAVSVDINLSANNTGRKIELRLNSPTGTLIGTLAVATTGGWTTYKTQSTTITNATGVHDLYLVGVGGNGVANIDWFIFKADAITSTTIAYAINTGGNSYKSSDGISYIVDANFTGGKSATTTNTITGTSNQTLYQSERYGNFSYSLPVSNGQFEVTLMFCEFYHNATGKRIFDVIIEGQEVISNLDIFKEAGKNTAYNKTFTVSVTDNKLDIIFKTDIDNAKVSAILVKTINSTTKSLVTVPVITNENDQITIYPVPATSMITIEGINNSQIIITNLDGTILLQKELINGPLDISLLKAGMYILQIIDGEKIFTKRIIKQ